MTSIRILGQLGLLVGLALILTTDASGDGCKPRKHGTVAIFHGKDIFELVREGDLFVAVLVHRGDRRPILRNFDVRLDMLVMDGKYLGYDLRGKNKNVLVREEIGNDIKWEFVRSAAKSPFLGYFRVKNGELKGWWIGVGTLEREKEGERVTRNRRGPRALLMLVKDKKDAVGFSWTTAKDD